MSQSDDAEPRRSFPRRSLPPTVAFVALVFSNAAMFLGTGVPTPVLLYLEEKWEFAPSMLTVAFASYSGGLLVTLLIFGGLADFVGRRPVLVIALLTQAAALIGLASAPDIGWFTAFRVLQGFTVGVATSAFTAFVVESAPANNKRIGSVLGSLAPPGALALGALFGGVAVEFADDPVSVSFVVLAAITVVCAALVYFSRETISRVPGALRSLLPVVAVPRQVRRAFGLLVPLLIASWMIPSLYLGLGPTIIRDVFQVDSGLLNGFAAFLMPASAATFGILLGRLPVYHLLRVGGLFCLLGPALMLVSVATGVLPLFMIGGMAGGVGFGVTFSSIVARLAPLAHSHERAGMLATMFLIAYVAFGGPAVIAGQFIAPFGVLPTILAFAAVIAAVALCGLILQLRQPRELTT